MIDLLDHIHHAMRFAPHPIRWGCMVILALLMFLLLPLMLFLNIGVLLEREGFNLPWVPISLRTLLYLGMWAGFILLPFAGMQGWLS